MLTLVNNALASYSDGNQGTAGCFMSSTSYPTDIGWGVEWSDTAISARNDLQSCRPIKDLTRKITAVLLRRWENLGDAISSIRIYRPQYVENFGRIFQKTNFELRYPEIFLSTTLATSGSRVEKRGCSETIGDTRGMGGFMFIHGFCYDLEPDQVDIAYKMTIWRPMRCCISAIWMETSSWLAIARNVAAAST